MKDALRSLIVITVLGFFVDSEAVADNWVGGAVANPGDWNTPTNWSAGLPDTNATAVFTTSTNDTVTLSAPASAASISFGNGADAFIIGAAGDPGITFGNGGGVTVVAGVTNSETVASDMTLGFYSAAFSNNSTTSTATLTIGSLGGVMTASNGETLYLDGSNTGSNTIDSDISGDASGDELSLSKSGAGTWVLAGNDSFGSPNAYNYGGGTFDVTGGVLNITGTTTVVANGQPVINVSGGAVLDVSGQGRLVGDVPVSVSAGSELLLDNRGTGNNTSNKLGAVGIGLNNGGSFVYEGADDDDDNSVQPVSGGISLNNGVSTITIAYNGTNAARVVASSLTHNAGGGLALVNGVNLGATSIGNGSVGQLVLSSAPTLVGTTAGGSSGINAGVYNTRIDPYLLGESGIASGQNGTATGTANTFLTYDTTSNNSNGFRPLNPTDEFMNNAVVTGDNTYITQATTASATTSINSLVINDSDLSIADGATMTDASGAILFVTSNAIKPSGTTGALNFGGTEGIISANAGVNGVISAAVSGTDGLTVYGPGTVTLSGQNTYSGITSVSTGGTLLVGSNSALGTSILQTSGGTISADNQARTLNNTLEDTGVPFTVGGSNNLTFAGDPTNHLAFTDDTYRNLAVYFSNTGVTTFSGTFSLNNAASGSNNSSNFINLGSSANVVISGAIQDANGGNNASNTNGLQVTWSGANANLTIANSTNNFGQGISDGASFFLNNGSTQTYDTLTLAGGTPLGAGSLGSNSGGVFLIALTNNETVANGFVATGGSINNYAFGLGFAGTNNLTLSGNIGNTFTFLNIAASTATLTFGGTVQSDITLGGSGNTTFGSTSTQTGGSFTTKDSGITTFSGVNNMTGTTSLNGGTAILDYSATSANGGSTRLASGANAGLALGGVNLQLSGGSFAQSVGTLGATLNQGTSSVTQTNGGTSTIALGAITRTVGSAIDFGTGAATTTNANTSGILGGYATVNGTDWAVSNGSGAPITALTSYDSFLLPGVNKNILQTDTGAVALSTTVNSLKITDTIAGQALAIVPTQTLSLASGGLLYTGANGYSITGGSLAAGTNELIINTAGTGTLGIASNLNSVFTKTGAGTVVLSGSEAVGYQNVYLNQGTVSVSSQSNLGTNHVEFDGGTLETTAGITFTGYVSLDFATNGGTIQVDTGTTTVDNTMQLNGTSYGGLTKTGAGTLLLQDNGNGFTGPVTVSAGTLQVDSSNAIGASSTSSQRSAAPVLVNGGNLDIDGQTLALGNVTLQSGSITDSVGTGSLAAYSFTLESGTVGASLADVILSGNTGSNAIDLYKTTAGTVVLSANNTYSGSTIISAGTLQLGNDGTTGSLGSANVTDNGTLAVDRSNAYTVNNAITGTGGFTQAGSGTTTLTNTNSYTGVTTISAGSLLLVSSSNSNIASSSKIIVGDSLADSSVTLNVTGISAVGGFHVQSGQTLAGHGTVIGDTTFDSGSIMSPGNSVGKTTYDGNLTLIKGVTLAFDLSSVGASDESVVTGAGHMLILNQQSISDFDFNLLPGFGPGDYTLIDSSANGVNGTLSLNPADLSEELGGYNVTLVLQGGDVVLDVQGVPEPSTWAMMIGGVSLLVIYQCQRSRQNTI